MRENEAFQFFTRYRYHSVSEKYNLPAKHLPREIPTVFPRDKSAAFKVKPV